MPAPRKPVAMKEVLGTRRADRENPAAPDVPALEEVESPPDWLTDRGKKGWALLAGLLVDMRVLARTDRAALSMLCEDFALWRTLTEDLDLNGLTQWVETTTGDSMERQRPQVGMHADVVRRLNVQFGQFGLTPATRGKVAVLPGAPPANDPLRKFFGSGQ